jgi:UDPglucose 6-dehydrogenase
MISKIGIIGLGFVGGAIRQSMAPQGSFIELVLVDPAKGETGTYADLKDADGVFVCVPTPQDADGTCDTGPLESVLSNLKAIDYHGVIISKCTAPPDTYEKLNEHFPNLVHAPEFLTAAKAVQDYASGRFCIIGGRVKAYLREAERIIRIGQASLNDQVVYCTIGEAALAKYAINTFLATKVIFMNELHSIATASGLDYNRIVKMINMDYRIGRSHMQVPGPDGQFGFGGACFPKDTSALLKYAEQIGVVTPMVLDAAVRKNVLLRLTDSK